MGTEPTDPPPDDDPLYQFVWGLEKRIGGGDERITTKLSDRELAAVAWPEGPPDGYGKSWSDLSSRPCDEAIDRQLKSAPQSDN